MVQKLLQLILVLGACFIIGCAKKAPAPSSQERLVEYFDHYVSYQGETLGQIAKWYTGKSSNWQEILSHNPNLDVRRMRVGNVVHIPRHLMIRDDIMPKQVSEKKEEETLPGQLPTPQDDTLTTPEELAPSQAIEESNVQPTNPGTPPSSSDDLDGPAPDIVINIDEPQQQLQEAPKAAPPAPTQASAPPTKSRDELLKELTQEY